MRTNPNLKFELELWSGGLTYVAGLDEAGRGALAGPVAVGAVILPRTDRGSNGRVRRHPNPADYFRGVRDSKQMTPRQREVAAAHIHQYAMAWGVGFSSPQEIDAWGIVAAVRLAALRALQELRYRPDYLLTDFRLELPELDVCQTSMVRGDAHCLSIAAASVLAKTARDAVMRELDEQIPGYGLGQHKGYGTRSHRLALQGLGYSAVHRRSFSFSH